MHHVCVHSAGMDTRAILHPPVEPYDSGMLALDDVHTMYWETSGNPAGAPVLFVHGGPGGGCSPEHRRFFDPEFFRIVLFDQRGAGASTPVGDALGNTTQHLIADMELLRKYLDIDRWLIFGGSWGSTLGLAYGQAHPERCSGFVLRGIFLGRQSEIDWFLYGLRTIFPEAWHRFASMLPPAERKDLLRGYLKRLFDTDARVYMPFARAWSEYEGSCSTLLPNPELVRHFADEALGLARMCVDIVPEPTVYPEERVSGDALAWRELGCTALDEQASNVPIDLPMLQAKSSLLLRLRSESWRPSEALVEPGASPSPDERRLGLRFLGADIMR